MYIYTYIYVCVCFPEVYYSSLLIGQPQWIYVLDRRKREMVMRFEILWRVLLRIRIFLDVTPCLLVFPDFPKERRAFIYRVMQYNRQSRILKEILPNKMRFLYSRVDKHYRYVPHNDVSVDDGPHIRRWSHNIIIQYYITSHCYNCLSYSVQ